MIQLINIIFNKLIINGMNNNNNYNNLDLKLNK